MVTPSSRPTSPSSPRVTTNPNTWTAFSAHVGTADKLNIVIDPGGGVADASNASNEGGGDAGEIGGAQAVAYEQNMDVFVARDGPAVFEKVDVGIPQINMGCHMFSHPSILLVKCVVSMSQVDRCFQLLK